VAPGHHGDEKPADVTYYDHPAKESPPDPDDPRRLCFTCGGELNGIGPTLMHHDEIIRLATVPREYIPALHDCTAIVEQALSHITSRASDHDVARAVVAALIQERYIRVKRAAPPRKTSRRR
jgi:hypothetical protein